MPQQLVGINLPGDPAQGGVRQAQLLGGQFQPLHRQLRNGGLGMIPGQAQAIDLARTRSRLGQLQEIHAPN